MWRSVGALTYDWMPNPRAQACIGNAMRFFSDIRKSNRMSLDSELRNRPTFENAFNQRSATTRFPVTPCGEPDRLARAISACRGQLAGGKSQHIAIGRASPLDQLRSSRALLGNASPNVRGPFEYVLNLSCFFRPKAIMSASTFRSRRSDG